MARNRLQELHDAGQSIWLDSIDRRILHDGELDRRIREDALTGMTSNPTIFQKALASSSAYDDQIIEAEEKGATSWQLFELLETTDVRDACDHFAAVYSSTRGADGYVSIEVSPGVDGQSARHVRGGDCGAAPHCRRDQRQYHASVRDPGA